MGYFLTNFFTKEWNYLIGAAAEANIIVHIVAINIGDVGITSESRIYEASTTNAAGARFACTIAAIFPFRNIAAEVICASITYCCGSNMVRDGIQKQSTGSKKIGRKYKDIIKNGEFCLMICFEIERKKIDNG